MIYDFYIFDRHCNCIFFVSWHRVEGRFEARPPLMPPGATDTSGVGGATGAAAAGGAIPPMNSVGGASAVGSLTRLHGSQASLVVGPIAATTSTPSATTATTSLKPSRSSNSVIPSGLSGLNTNTSGSPPMVSSPRSSSQAYLPASDPSRQNDPDNWPSHHPHTYHLQPQPTSQAVSGSPSEWTKEDSARLQLVQEHTKLVYGVIYSLKNVSRKLKLNKGMDGSDFLSFKTNKYRLHYHEVPSGYKFILSTDPSVPAMKEVLKQIYAQIFVEWVVKNPAWKQPDPKAPSQPIECELFRSSLSQYVRFLSVFE